MLPRMTKPVVLGAGILSAGLLGFLLDLDVDAPPLQSGRREATETAHQTLIDQGITLGPSWKTLPAVRGGVDGGDRFVWQKGGESTYQSLLGTYLEPPHWVVRFALFEGDVAERAEEYRVYIGPQGEVLRTRHLLPEARYSTSLSEEEARRWALPVIQEKFDLTQSQIEEISAVASSLPNRKDWAFTFADRHNYRMEDGEARITVTVAGNEVADVHRWIHVPEEWQRRERDKATLTQIVGVFGWVVVSAFLMSGVIGAIIAWSRKRFTIRAFIGGFVVLLCLGILDFANSWPAMMSRFQTAQPLENQFLMVIGGGLVSLLVTAAGPAMILGLLGGRHSTGSGLDRRNGILLGLALGAVVAGIATATQSLAPSLSPDWPHYAPAGTYYPILSVVLSPMIRFMRTTILFLLLFFFMDRFSNAWSKRRLLLSIGVILFGLALAGLGISDDLGYWLITGLVIGLVLLASYALVLRFEPALVPAAIGSIVVIEVLRSGLYQAHPAALPGALVAAGLVAAASALWSSTLLTKNATAS